MHLNSSTSATPRILAGCWHEVPNHRRGPRAAVAGGTPQFPKGDQGILTNDCTAPMGITFPMAMIVQHRRVPPVARWTGVALVIGCDNNMGQIGGVFAMRRAIDAVRTDGVAVAVVGRSSHTGTIDYNVRTIVAEDMVRRGERLSVRRGPGGCASELDREPAEQCRTATLRPRPRAPCWPQVRRRQPKSPPAPDRGGPAGTRLQRSLPA